jgi:hypothetical protein
VRCHAQRTSAVTTPASSSARRPRGVIVGRVDDHRGLGLSNVRAIAIAHDATLTANARAQEASR